jgi:signal transduction histidine kinase
VADVDLGELARWAAATTVPPALAARVEVADDVPLVRGRYDALARALTNVLLNAVDASAPGGEVLVRVARADGDAVEVAVRDRGHGIAPERLQHIWDPYVTHKAHGTGLGLAIARQTVLAHGGRVDAVSAVGCGTEVRFILPVRGAPAAPTTTATPEGTT